MGVRKPWSAGKFPLYQHLSVHIDIFELQKRSQYMLVGKIACFQCDMYRQIGLFHMDERYKVL